MWTEGVQGFDTLPYEKMMVNRWIFSVLFSIILGDVLPTWQRHGRLDDGESARFKDFRNETNKTTMERSTIFNG